MNMAAGGGKTSLLTFPALDSVHGHGKIAVSKGEESGVGFMALSLRVVEGMGEDEDVRPC